MIAIISDVHGNYPALKSVLNKIDEIGCDSIISLGDVAGYYCMVNECIDEFRRRKVVNILGNHDSYIIGKGQCPRSATVNNCIDYQKKILTKENYSYLESSLQFLDNSCISARHGGWNDPLDEYINEFDFSISKKYLCKFFCSGHTHIQKIQQCGDITYFNPGSVGQPRDGNPKASFALICNNSVNLIRVEYPVDEIFERMQQEGFEDRISECLYKGTKVESYVTKIS